MVARSLLGQQARREVGRAHERAVYHDVMRLQRMERRAGGGARVVRPTPRDLGRADTGSRLASLQGGARGTASSPPSALIGHTTLAHGLPSGTPQAARTRQCSPPCGFVTAITPPA